MQYDRASLLELDNARNREIFARATVLDRYERPLETIEGKITSGSINVDGTSSVRRSCSLSMVAKDVAIHNAYWGLRSKIKLEAGVRNMAKGANSTVYWFKLGVFVLTDFSVQQSLNNFTISLSGKDKMCLLNGEVGGHFMAMTDLGQLEDIDEDNNSTFTALKISTIIKEMLIGVGNELPQNIILNNVDDYGVELLTYKGTEPMYIIFAEATRIGLDYYIGNNAPVDDQYRYNGEPIGTFAPYEEQIPPISKLTESDFSFDDDDNFIVQKTDSQGTITCAVFKVEQNHVCGYRMTDLTYPGQLIASVGETITSILDKIKNQFGTFEYFYDLDGHFVFQAKQLYTNTAYNSRTDYTSADTESYVESPFVQPKYSYYFNDNNLLTAIHNSPALGNIKNDFTIWGQNINELAIHLRYAIDIKPVKYTTYDGIEYSTLGELDKDTLTQIYNNSCLALIDLDWLTEELLNYEHNRALLQGQIESGEKSWDDPDEYGWTIADYNEFIANTKSNIADVEDDLNDLKEQKSAMFRQACDWREIIYQMALDWFKYYHHGGQTTDEGSTADTFTQVLQKQNPDNEMLVLYGRTGYEQYYTDIEGFWRYLYNPFSVDNYESYDPFTGFNILIETDPESLIFDFDFLDADTSDVGAYSVSYIGDRTKISNNNAIKVIKYEEVPNILYLGSDNLSTYDDEQIHRLQEGYYGIWISKDDMEKYIDLAARGKSCYDELDNLLYNYTYLNQSISLTSIPIYYLEPNTLIYIKDETNDINGEYAINRMTIPLTYNGSMSITANRIPQRLY